MQTAFNHRLVLSVLSLAVITESLTMVISFGMASAGGCFTNGFLLLSQSALSGIFTYILSSSLLQKRKVSMQTAAMSSIKRFQKLQKTVACKRQAIVALHSFNVHGRSL
jgi:hypothetical protein